MNLQSIDHSELAEPKTLAASLAARLREAILEGELAPGSRLGLTQLSKRFNVSLSPLREALSRLSSEGLVVIEDLRGFRVSSVSADNCREIVRLRMELESLALSESIRNGNDAWEERLAGSYHRLRKVEQHARVDGEFKAEWEQLNRNFHQALMAACGMPMLTDMCARLNDMFDRYRRLFLAEKSPALGVIDEHAAIYEAAVARDTALAVQMLRKHIEGSGFNVIPVVEKAESAERARSARPSRRASRVASA